MYIAGDNTPEENPENANPPSDDMKQPVPSPRDVSAECEEVDYDTDFEDDVSDAEQDKGTPKKQMNTFWNTLALWDEKFINKTVIFFSDAGCEYLFTMTVVTYMKGIMVTLSKIFLFLFDRWRLVGYHQNAYGLTGS